MLKSIRVFITILVASLATSTAIIAQKATVDSVGYVSNTRCIVSKVADIYVLTPDNNPTQRFAPVNMETLYKKEGAAVMVSGVIGAVPPNARLMGTPFEIRSIGFADGGMTGGVKPSKGSNDNELIFDRPVTDKGIVGKENRHFVIKCGNVVYRPVNLPKKFQVQGRSVKFVGKAAALPAEAKAVPLKLEQTKWVKGKAKK